MRPAALTAILRIQHSQAVVVAIPGEMPDPEVCDLARLVLNQPEYDELVRVLATDSESGPQTAAWSRPSRPERIRHVH